MRKGDSWRVGEMIDRERSADNIDLIKFDQKREVNLEANSIRSKIWTLFDRDVGWSFFEENDIIAIFF